MSKTSLKLAPTSHYLEFEFFELVQSDRRIIEFIESGCLDGIWLWDLENPEQEWMSPRFWRTLGYDPDTKLHLASAWQDIINPDDLAVAVENFNRHCENPDHPYDQIVRYRHAEGHNVWVRCRGIAIRDDDGRPVRMLGAHSDVTALKKAEDALKQRNLELSQLADTLARREKELELILDNVPAKIWYKDAHNRILRANEAAATSMGSTPNVLKGADVYLHFPEMAEKYHRDDLEVIHSGKASRNIIESYAPKDGQQGWVSTDKIPLNVDGAEKTLLVVSRDITENVMREEQLKRLNANLRDFASVTAHDLKAPLRQTSMFVGLLQNELERLDLDLNESAEDALRGIHAGLDRMKRIVKSLYELFSVEALQTEKSVTPLNDIIDEAVAQLSVLIEEKNASLEIEALPSVAVSPDYMVQVFQNLIANACKYTNTESPVITISYERDIANRLHKILISDNGPGVPVAMQDAVFEPYKRLHHDSDIDGNGIGLALCRRIMTLHMGDIRLDPDCETGARFILSLPLD